MKHSAEKFITALTASIALLTISAACAKSNKAKDVAQDSILVKDADVAEHKTDTAGAATAALVRERGGGAAQLPALTNGPSVPRPSDVAPTMTIPRTAESGASASRTSSSTKVPPKRVYPSPVLPARDSTSSGTSGALISSPTTPQATTQPTPVTQPVSPSPPPVSQPTPPTPKKDSSTDSLTARRS